MADADEVFVSFCAKCAINHHSIWLGWVVFRILRHFNHLSVISRLGSRRYPNFEIEMARLGFEPRTHCSASQELHHSTTAALCYRIWKAILLVYKGSCEVAASPSSPPTLWGYHSKAWKTDQAIFVHFQDCSPFLAPLWKIIEVVAPPPPPLSQTLEPPMESELPADSGHFWDSAPYPWQ